MYRWKTKMEGSFHNSPLLEERKFKIGNFKSGKDYVIQVFMDLYFKGFIFRCASISSTYPCQSVPPYSRYVSHFFGFPFCQCLWTLAKRRDDIVVADMVADIVADMKVDKVVDKKKERNKKKKWPTWSWTWWPRWRKTRWPILRWTRWPTSTSTLTTSNDINIDIQFGERIGHRGWENGPKLFRPEAYPACGSSKLCKFII